MATRIEFLLAADKLTSAAEQVGALMSAAENTDADRILRGGALGTQVPLQIAESARTAQICRIRIEDAAETCRQRAAAIELYEHELALYDQAYRLYEGDFQQWGYRYDSYVLDRTGLAMQPGPPPIPPPPPAPLPEWADVRRPETS